MASLPADPPVLTSKSARVKAARGLARRVSRAQQRLFLAEGPQAVREALDVDGCVVEVFAVPATAEQHREIFESAAGSGVAWRHVDDAALGALTETVHPQGVVAVCRFLDRPLEHILHAGAGGRNRLVAVCADVRDPGNAGTVIRCADAAGAEAVVLAGCSVDPYNGKAVRASAGSLFHVRLAVEPDVSLAVDLLQRRGLQVLAADGAGELTLDDAVDDGLLAGPTAWLFGNEAWGLPDEMAVLANHRVAIPIHGRAESLNLATAAAVCLYASARAQRHDTLRLHPQDRTVPTSQPGEVTPPRPRPPDSTSR
ncbi:MAG: RNA methyltransferase [Actinomycetota bacterium]|nr:RNA methyltransferase [Actinomycetota bacterium]